MKALFEFDYKKATQAINLLAQKEGGKINKMKAIKLIYFAERYHLRRYGRPITNDHYLAMSYGPVGSTVKDVVGFSDFLDPAEKQYAESFLSQTDNRYTIASTNETDLDVFSESDIEALNFSYNKLGTLDEFKLAKLSHIYPEWAKFARVLVNKEVTREDMNYIDFFDNPGTQVDDIFAGQNGFVESSKEIFEENYKLALKLA